MATYKKQVVYRNERGQFASKPAPEKEDETPVNSVLQEEAANMHEIEQEVKQEIQEGNTDEVMNTPHINTEINIEEREELHEWVNMTSFQKDSSTIRILPKAVKGRPVPEGVPLDHQTLYFNRELSWLDFNARVLVQARDTRWPLLERVRFLAIAYNNLDEFFRKRVGALKRLVDANVRIVTADGRLPEDQLKLIRQAILPFYGEMWQIWNDELRPCLANQSAIEIVDYDDATEEEKIYLKDYFKANLFPILTPLGVDPGHPFPFLSNLSLSLGVLLRHPTRGTEHFARIKVPTKRFSWVKIGDTNRYIPVEQVIAHNLKNIFRGMTVEGVYAFRVTRNADLSLNEDEAEDLLEMISEEVRKRRFATIVRLEVEKSMPQSVREMLMHELDLHQEEVFEVDGMLDLSRCFSLVDLDFPELKFKPWDPIYPPRLKRNDEDEGKDFFAMIREGDFLVHHPYESFKLTTQRFVEEAANDPNVVAIKQTLYRTSSDSSIVRNLMKAAEQGKEVAVLVEVKASLDEERNIAWANMMSQQGIHVTYGLVGLKTHAKTILVLREEEDGLRTYCHIGTGNYNSSTARLYTDLGLITCDPVVGLDVINLYHYLTGYAPEQHYRKLMVAPKAMRSRFIELIENEIENQKQFGNGHIMAKMNALDDIEMISVLYKASQAGVKVDLIVRGHCRLRPQLAGYSDNIRVISIIGRFLEHSRIYYFHNNGDPHVSMGSADWQRRNLDDRVEVILPVEDQMVKERLIRILTLALEDNRLAWETDAQGQYIQHIRAEGEGELLNFHDLLMRRAQQRVSGTSTPWDL
jgi:polyphosphate kinase